MVECSTKSLPVSRPTTRKKQPDSGGLSGIRSPTFKSWNSVSITSELRTLCGKKKASTQR
jgi:hypothetical protein